VAGKAPTTQAPSTDALIERACALLAGGGILALQGVGGFQLLVDGTNAAAIERVNLRFGEAIIDIANTFIKAIGGGNRIGNHSVIEPMAAGIDDDGALNADLLMQLPELIQPAIMRNIAGIRRIGILIAGAKNMGMRIAAQRRGFESGLFGIGIGGQNSRGSHDRPSQLGSMDDLKAGLMRIKTGPSGLRELYQEDFRKAKDLS
jgi:hypothetical protein